MLDGRLYKESGEVVLLDILRDENPRYWSAQEEIQAAVGVGKEEASDFK